MTRLTVTDDDDNVVAEGKLRPDGDDIEIIIKKNETDDSDETIKQKMKVMIVEGEGEWSI